MVLNIFLKKITLLFKIILIKVMNLKNINFMNQKSNSSKIEHDELEPDNDASDYTNLIIRLKEIRSIIGLLKKEYSHKL